MVFIADSVLASDVYLQDQILLRHCPKTLGGNVLCCDGFQKSPDAR